MLKIHHIAITVSNLEKSKEFYSKILKLLNYSIHFSNTEICVITPPKDSKNMPEFLLYQAKSEQINNIHITYDPGAHHYCFEVESEDMINQLFIISKDFGVEILDPPQDYPNYANNTGSKRYYALYINDPDNIKLEFIYLP